MMKVFLTSLSSVSSWNCTSVGLTTLITDSCDWVEWNYVLIVCCGQLYLSLNISLLNLILSLRFSLFSSLSVSPHSPTGKWRCLTLISSAFLEKFCSISQYYLTCTLGALCFRWHRWHPSAPSSSDPSHFPQHCSPPQPSRLPASMPEQLPLLRWTPKTFKHN